jgi:phage head maturation protease
MDHLHQLTAVLIPEETALLEMTHLTHPILLAPRIQQIQPKQRQQKQQQKHQHQQQQLSRLQRQQQLQLQRQ